MRKKTTRTINTRFIPSPADVRRKAYRPDTLRPGDYYGVLIVQHRPTRRAWTFPYTQQTETAAGLAAAVFMRRIDRDPAAWRRTGHDCGRFAAR